MKRNTFMKRLAVTALAATMTLGTVPATAVATFADDTATEAPATTSDITNVEPASDDEADYASQLRALTNVGATTTDNADVIADKIQKALGAGFTVSKASDLSDGETSTEKVLTIDVLGAKGEQTYTVTVKVSDTTSSAKTNAQKLADVSKYVQNQLNAKKDFKSTGEFTENDIKAVVGQILAKYETKSDLVNYDGKSINYGVSVDNDASTDSTDQTRGKVVGNVTFYFPASEKDDAHNYKGEDATSKTISFEGKRAFVNRTLTDDMFDTLADDQENTGIWTVQDDATDDTLTARANAWIANKQKDANSSWNNITATVTGITQVDQKGHAGTEDGTAIATLSLTDGTRTLSGDVTLSLKHSDSAKLDEFDKAITDKSAAYKTTAIQKKNATKAATKDQVASGVRKILNDAVATKLDNKALSADGWSKTDNDSVSVFDTTENGLPNSIITDRPDQKGNVDGKVTGPQRYFAFVAYTPATTKAEGQAVVSVYSYIPDTEKNTNARLSGEKVENEDVTKTTTFTLTFGTLKRQANTYLRFNADSQTFQYDTTKPDNVNSTEEENKDADNTYTIKDLLKTNGNDELKWTSSDEKVVLVDQQGRITLKGTGSAEITVSDVDNDKLSATITINSGDKWIFSDVQSSSKYYFNPVYWAVRRGITAGTDNTTFGVGQNVTRAQMVTWLWKEAGQPAVTKSNQFSDVADTAYYAKAVDWAVAKGITSGTTATTFSPNEVVNRAQAVTFLYKAYGQNEDYNAKVNFTDVSPKAYYYTAIQWAVENEVTAGKTATTFGPTDGVTREQAVTFLAKAAHYANDTKSYADGKNVQ